MMTKSRVSDELLKEIEKIASEIRIIENSESYTMIIKPKFYEKLKKAGLIKDE